MFITLISLHLGLNTVIDHLPKSFADVLVFGGIENFLIEVTIIKPKMNRTQKYIGEEVRENETEASHKSLVDK